MKNNFREINRQINKEALYTIFLFVLFFIWWYFTAYGLADIELRIFGLPAWFFFSCIVGWLLCCVGVTLLVKKFFRNIDLEEYNVDEDHNCHE